MKSKMVVIILSWAVGLGGLGGQVPRGCDQLVVAVSEGWDGSTARMMRFERGARGWEPVGSGPVNVLLGRNGLAWGRGVHGIPRGAPGGLNREGDGRAPAGCFAISKVFGYDPALPSGSNFPYRQVGPWDAWPDDSGNPYYNRHLVVDPRNVPPWFEKAKMRHGDAAYRWLVEIRHNADPPVPGAGSAIFFHLRRGPDRKTSGCTTMAESDLVTMIRWLREKENPHYVLLPRADYELLRASWGLPAMP